MHIRSILLITVLSAACGGEMVSDEVPSIPAPAAAASTPAPAPSAPEREDPEVSSDHAPPGVCDELRALKPAGEVVIEQANALWHTANMVDVWVRAEKQSDGEHLWLGVSSIKDECSWWKRGFYPNMSAYTAAEIITPQVAGPGTYVDGPAAKVSGSSVGGGSTCGGDGTSGASGSSWGSVDVKSVVITERTDASVSGRLEFVEPDGRPSLTFRFKGYFCDTPYVPRNDCCEMP